MGDIVRSFDQPIELRSVQSADRTLVRFVPMLILMAIGVLVLALLLLGLMFPRSPGLYYPLSVLIAVAVPMMMYRQKRRRLSIEYTELKTLTLSAEGLRRVDGTTVVEIPWAGITRLQEESVSVGTRSTGPIVLPVTGVVNAAKNIAHSVTAVGIMGSGVVAPVPGASQRVLKVLDERSGSRLQFGEVRHTSDALIFPSEFERDWTSGIIGQWLAHYRPDLRVQ